MTTRVGGRRTGPTLTGGGHHYAVPQGPVGDGAAGADARVGGPGGPIRDHPRGGS